MNATAIKHNKHCSTRGNDRLGYSEQGRGELLVFCPLCQRGPFTDAGLIRHVCREKRRHGGKPFLTAEERSRAIVAKGGTK